MKSMFLVLIILSFSSFQATGEDSVCNLKEKYPKGYQKAPSIKPSINKPTPEFSKDPAIGITENALVIGALSLKKNPTPMDKIHLRLLKQNSKTRIDSLNARKAKGVISKIESVELKALLKNPSTDYVYLKIKKHLGKSTIAEDAEAKVLDEGGSRRHAALAYRKALGTITPSGEAWLTAIEESGDDDRYVILALRRFRESKLSECDELEYQFIRKALIGKKN